MNRITVMGGGNGAHAMAADLALRGYPVMLFELPQFAQNIARTLETRMIEFRDGLGSHRAQLAGVTTDVQEAVTSADWLMVVVPSLGHEPMARTCAPYVCDGQKIVIYAGSFGSLIFRKALNACGCKAKVVVAETSTLPYGARLLEPGVVSCPLRAERVLAATFPACDQDPTIRDLQKMYPAIQAAKNVAAVALSNVNPIVHPVGTLLNAGRIEYSGGDFYLYEEGITSSVARAIQEIHREFTAVGEALDARPAQYEERAFRSRTSITSAEFRADFDTERVIGGFKGPFNVKEDRYVSEDVPYGLVVVASIAEMIGVPVPTIRATVQLFSVINGVDYWCEGWTVEKLGIAGLTAAQLGHYLEVGGANASQSPSGKRV